MKAVSAEKIEKNFGKIKALREIDLVIEKNEIYGLIGPDGSGKTTFFRIVASLMTPDSGSVRVMDIDPVKDHRKVRKIIGYMPGRFSLYQDLTVKENLSFFASVYGSTIEENYHLVEDIYKQIEPFRNRKAGALSGGMKQKLALSCSLIHAPELLILDEPTTGVDAVSRKEFWEMLAKLKSMGITILVSTPYMDEASQCDRIALIKSGEILATESPEGVRNLFKGNLYSGASRKKYDILQKLRQADFTGPVYAFGDSAHFTMQTDSEEAEAYLRKNGIEDAKVMQIKPDIEDVFMQLIDRKSNEK